MIDLLLNNVAKTIKSKERDYKIENQVNDSGQSSIVPYGSDELEIYENILTPLKVEHVHVVASKKTG